MATNFEWMPQALPKVAALVRDKRREWGDKHVTECVRRGLSGEPGYFFAREGAIAVGTPWDLPELANFAAWNVTKSQALVMMRNPEGQANGAN